MQNNIKSIVSQLLKQEAFNVQSLRRCGFSHCTIRQFKTRRVVYEKTTLRIIAMVCEQRRELASKKTAQQVYSWAVRQKMNRQNMALLFALEAFNDALAVAAFWFTPTTFNEILIDYEKR
jgi:tRNA(Phe) wybutosine-synthesizing methylase Tyw3